MVLEIDTEFVYREAKFYYLKGSRPARPFGKVKSVGI